MMMMMRRPLQPPVSVLLTVLVTGIGAVTASPSACRSYRDCEKRELCVDDGQCRCIRTWLNTDQNGCTGRSPVSDGDRENQHRRKEQMESQK
jgi:hypothetical protein